MNSYKLTFINMAVIALLASAFAYAQDKELNTNSAPIDAGVTRYLITIVRCYEPELSF